jgi:3-hydroxyisobutyrate dehydrogenase
LRPERLRGSNHFTPNTYNKTQKQKIMNTPKIGWIGLGNMGTPIVKNLLKAGHTVHVFNRTKEKETEAVNAGALSTPSPAAIMESCDIIFTMVSDDAAAKVVFDGKEGLLQKERPGKLVIDMSTVAPETSRYLADRCNEKGIAFLEAPVSGSVKPAQDATLIILAAGEAEAYARAKPLFDVIGKLSLHLGGQGAGSSAKLAMNYFVAASLQGLAEMVVFAEANGVKKEDMLTILNEGSFGSPALKLKSTSIVANTFPPAFALKLMAKDLRLMKDAGLDTPMFPAVHDSYQQATQTRLAEEDVMAILKYLEKK